MNMHESGFHTVRGVSRANLLANGKKIKWCLDKSCVKIGSDSLSHKLKRHIIATPDLRMTSLGMPWVIIIVRFHKWLEVEDTRD